MRYKTAIIIICLILFSLYLFRINNLNRNNVYPENLNYNLCDEVEIGNDYFDSSDEDMNGYTVTVLKTELLTTDEFKSKYGAENESILDRYEYIILIYTKFKNISNDKGNKTGINLSQYIFQESSYMNLINRDAFPLVNDFNSLRFSLQLDSEKEIIIPFGIDTRNININRIINGNPQLVISLYPHKKSILLT